MAPNEALVTPELMEWARKSAHLCISEAAKRIGRSEEEIAKWEKGELRPTIAQARKASQVYKRSLAVFYLPEPPKEFDVLKDFRHLPDTPPNEYGPKLALIIRRIQARQEWLHDYLAAENTDALPFVGSVSIDTPASAISHAIRHQLDVTPEEQINCLDTRMALNLWIEKAEAAGIYVAREGGIKTKEARGFVISDKLAPFIFLNSNDAYAGQLFTLVHELAHLWLGDSSVSNLEGPANSVADPDVIREGFCNRIASLALLEPDIFNSLWHESHEQGDLEKQIGFMAKRLKVSEEVVARRLFDLGIINQKTYLELRQIFQDRWQEFGQQRHGSSTGGPSFYLMKAINT